MEPGSEPRGASAEAEWKMLTLRVRVKRSVLDQMGGAVQRPLARSTPFTR